MITNRPEFVKNEHLNYLDSLRKIGATNMFGARPWLKNAYPELSDEESRQVLAYWIDSFEERYTEGKEND